MYKSLFIALVILSSCKRQEEIILSQKINNWEFEYEGGWRKAIVPGNNFSDLLKHNFILDPFYGTNEDSLQWVAKRDWFYKSEFLVTENTLKQQNQIFFDQTIRYNRNNASKTVGFRFTEKVSRELELVEIM